MARRTTSFLYDNQYVQNKSILKGSPVCETGYATTVVEMKKAGKYIIRIESIYFSIFRRPRDPSAFAIFAR